MTLFYTHADRAGQHSHKSIHTDKILSKSHLNVLCLVLRMSTWAPLTHASCRWPIFPHESLSYAHSSRQFVHVGVQFIILSWITLFSASRAYSWWGNHMNLILLWAFTYCHVMYCSHVILEDLGRIRGTLWAHSGRILAHLHGMYYLLMILHLHLHLSGHFIGTIAWNVSSSHDSASFWACFWHHCLKCTFFTWFCIFQGTFLP